jgi:LPXTG-motif cell wall-anchored protein
MVGTSAVAYGMFKGNNLIFIIGMLFVIGGYVLIRRKIKEAIHNRP